MLLVNSTTDIEFVKEILDARWQELRIDSPNARAATPTARLIEVNGSESRAVRRLMQVAAALARAAPLRDDILGSERAHIFSASRNARPIAT